MIKGLQITERSQTAAAWVGMASFAVAVFLLLSDAVSFWWLAASFVMYVAVYLANTVGAHRLFAHRSFDCHRLWHKTFSLFCTLSMQGSAISYVHVHHAHHVLADTTEDPHINGWSYMFVRRYRPVNKRTKIVARLMQDAWHRRLHDYALVPVLLLSAALAAIDPLLLLFGYWAPVGYYFIVNGIHMALCHQQGKPVNIPWMECLFPMGEWRHANHHQHPTQWDYGRWDLGSYLIRAIRQ